MELDQQILDLKLMIDEKDKYERKLSDAMNEYNALKQKTNELKQILEKEQKDVERLEKLSFSLIWYSFIGRKNEKLWKEKDEFSKAEYDYKLSYDTLQTLEEEVNDYKRRLNDIRLKEAQLEQLLSQKENVLINSDTELGEQLKSINHKINVQRRKQKELKEAMDAGNTLKGSLNNVLNSLNKARNWGTWDMFGGGFLADMAKHSHINDANNQIERLKYNANKFTRELKDVNLSLDVHVNISDTLKFADWFFDGIFVDYAVQNRINDGIYQVQQQMRNVNSILEDLNDSYIECERNIESLTKEKKALVQ